MRLTPAINDVLRYKTRNMLRARFYAIEAVQALPVQRLDGTQPGDTFVQYTLRRCRQDGSPSTGNFVPEFTSWLCTAAGWSTTPAKARRARG